MICVVDYGMGNVQSVANALDHLGVPNVLSADPAEIRAADKLILPGVGAFDKAMHNIAALGLRPVLDEQARERRKPILGICLGMQLLASSSEEGWACQGLGWVAAAVVRVEAQGLKVPHIGWNTTALKEDCPLFAGLGPEVDFYYVHSYVMTCAAEVVVATCDYGARLVTGVQAGNIFGTQFHPEKSQDNGLAILRNFAGMLA